MKNKVAIIGKFGAGENWCDGQTIKTKNLLMLLESTKKFSLVKVDTCYFKKNSLKLLLDSIKGLFTCDHIFLLVSVNGMNFYLPFLHYLNKITRRRIYHYIIGSELLQMVSENPGLVKYLNSLTSNWFEYDTGTEYLKSKGVSNVSTLPNIKLLTPISEPNMYNDEQHIFRFCTFSRVMEEKGITDAINAISLINEENGKIVATLDIYGQIDPNYESKLKALLESNTNCVSYKGIIDSQASVETLKDYYALLFPTQWVGEGLPGTLIDAFAAGIPVIATDWNANKEIIHNNKQGIVYPNNEMKTLIDAVNWSIEHKDEMDRMRKKSRQAFERYSPQAVLEVILSKMED